MDYDGCSAMALAGLERAKIDIRNKEKWTAEAERWNELARAENSWRSQKKQPQQLMHAGPMAQQRQWSQPFTLMAGRNYLPIVRSIHQHHQHMWLAIGGDCCLVSTRMRAAWRPLSR